LRHDGWAGARAGRALALARRRQFEAFRLRTCVSPEVCLIALLRLLACALACLTAGAGGAAAADPYPTRPVRWIVGYPPGGTTDIMARIIGQWLSERLGQQVVIENKPGAGNNIGTEMVVRAAADGYTVLLVNPANAINATAYKKLNFNFIRDIAPVAGIARVPNVMEVNPQVQARTVGEFVAYAKANPGKINMASSGNGTSVHLSGELFKFMTGVNMIHVPYRGSAPALTDLIGGQVQLAFVDLPSSIEYVKAGRLRALAVTTAMRAEALPETPTVSDFVPGFEASGWFGVGAPRNTPAAIIDTLNREINAALANPEIKARLAKLGVAAFISSPAEFGKFIADETEKWAKVINFLGIKPQ
jgi:tripartite-type tricarboxylate transporter receptor subunit TctC